MSDYLQRQTRTIGLSTIVSILCFLMMPSKILANELNNQSAIVKMAHSGFSQKDISLSLSFATQAQEREKDDIARGQLNWGALAKMWCEAALYTPIPELLTECARARFGAIFEFSNPTPSIEAVRRNQLDHSLILVRAALEIAGGSITVSDELREQMSKDANCIRSLIDGTAKLSNCRAPYQ